MAFPELGFSTDRINSDDDKDAGRPAKITPLHNGRTKSRQKAAAARKENKPQDSKANPIGTGPPSNAKAASVKPLPKTTPASVRSPPPVAEALPTTEEDLMEYLLPKDLTRRWSNPEGHEVRVDEMGLLCDMINQLGSTIGCSSICIPWFQVRDLFGGTSSRVNAAAVMASETVRSMYFSRSMEEKKV